MNEGETAVEPKGIEKNQCMNDFVFIPDNLFIFKSFEISAKTPSKKLFEVVVNQIVESSPFPIEQLLWGFVQQKHRKNSWIWYAGLKDRIQGFLGTIPDDKHVVPYAALAILLADEKGNAWLSVENQTTVIIDGMPKLFLAEKCDDWNTIKANIGQKTSIATKYFVLKQILENHSYGYKCFLEFAAEDGQSFAQDVQVISEKRIWSADVRDKATLKLLKQQKETIYLANKGLKWVGCLLLFTLIFQVVLVFGKSLFSWKQKMVKRQTPIVKKIEDKDLLVRQMQSMLEQEMRPFELLGLLNSYRPKNIYFSNVTLDNAHNVIVEAVAETAMAVQEYVDKLQESERFETVHLDNINTSSQGTKFKLSCDFKEKKGSYFLNLKESL